MNPQQANQTTLTLVGVSKTLGGVKLFTGVNLQLHKGQSLAVVGESGSGKSTLLHLMAGLDQPDSGEVFWAGKAIQHLNSNAIAAMRLQHIGLVFQEANLLPWRNVDANIRFPFEIKGEKPELIFYGGMDATGIAFDGVDEALRVPGTDLRLFGKPESFVKRRMGVALARAQDTDTARSNAKLAASKVRPRKA